MNIVKLILICFSLILVGCSEDDPVSALTDAEILASFPGTYTMSGLAEYPGGDCSVAADAVTGECITDEDIMTEADCPVGMCSDDEYSTQALCEAADNDWDNLGWMNYSDYLAEDGMTITFLADGTYSEPDFICEDNDYNEIDAIDEAACEAAGGEVHAEQGTWTLSSSTLTLTDVDGEEICSGETSGDSFTCSDANDAKCHTSGSEDVAEPANQADCEAADGEWEDANCMDFTFTKI